jgi:hypothetical protein
MSCNVWGWVFFFGVFFFQVCLEIHQEYFVSRCVNVVGQVRKGLLWVFFSPAFWGTIFNPTEHDGETQA